MFDFGGWSHLVLLGIAALVLVPSKDLPKLMRNVGRWVGEARRMATEFRSHVDDALRDAELADVKANVEAEMREIEKAVDLRKTEAAVAEAMKPEPSPASASATTAVPPPGPAPELAATGETDPIGSAPTSPFPAAALAAVVTPAPAPAPSRLKSDGIEIVRAGRGSVAKRAAAGWKKSAGAETAS